MRKLALCMMLLAFSCGQWKVSSLKSEKIGLVGIGNGPGKVQVQLGESGLMEHSFLVKIARGNVYTTDNALKRIQVLERNGTPLLIIGPKSGKGSSKEGPPYSPFNFSIIGMMAVDSKGNIYAQNRFIPVKSGGGDEFALSPSYVLVFDKKGALQYTLGQLGSPDIPFDYIEDLEVDREDRLFVVTRKFDTWSVFRFSNRKRDFFADLGKLEFKETEGGETYTGRVENVKVLSSGEEFLIAAAYYHGLRFKYRKIFSYSLKAGKITRTLMNIPDPRNELFDVVDDKHLYLWNIDEKRTRFVICNFDGNIINNIQIKFADIKSYFGDILMDETGQFYSYHVVKDGIEILEWK